MTPGAICIDIHDDFNKKFDLFHSIDENDF